MNEALRDRLSLVATAPGVYLMKDEEGKVIYVGKAANLKKRLASYFSRTSHGDLKTGILVKKIDAFETIITGTEQEALILEASLIKRYRPRYNVILKDDKRYPALRLDTKSTYPNLTVVRKIHKDGALYFGPFASAHAMRQTLNFINKTFKLRKCKHRELPKRTRPCLNCQMRGCLAPCCLPVDKGEYDEMVREVGLFLKGRTPELIDKVKAEMLAASEGEHFERAAELRDKMFALNSTLEKQVVMSSDFQDRDVIALAKDPLLTVVTMLFIRGGFLLGSRHFGFPETPIQDEEIVGSFLRQYYESAHFIPKEVILPVPLEDEPLLEERLTALKGEKVSLLWPQRGEKVRLLQMAQSNAQSELASRRESEDRQADLLLGLRRKLALRNLPSRIECFDNSNISGTGAVSGMVVFANGKPLKADYRTYTLKNAGGRDDYGIMAEVLKRRYGKEEPASPLPDLLLLDGGKGQLNIAVAVLKELGLLERLDVAAIAKKDEKLGETQDKIYIPGRANPIIFGRDGGLLLFLMRIRDEAHRFAVATHRKRRLKSSFHSVLDDIPGIGPRRKKQLLGHFGSLKRIRAASLEELSALPGMNAKTAQAVLNGLNGE